MTALVLALVATASGVQADACFPAQPARGPGAIDPFKPPDPRATALNAAAKTLYRQGKWDEARTQYRAATAADPDFRAPTLNVACSFVRQERFAEATAEVLKLLEGAYVPWAREILEAADLGALKVRPEMARVRQAMAESARSWGSGLTDDVLFIARQRAPLRVPEASAGVFILGPQQEVYAWSPATGRYRQITAEDGRVLAMVRSGDRRRLLYVTGDKLVHTPGGGRSLRGLALRELDLPAMSLGRSIPIAGDVTRLEIGVAGRAFIARVAGDKTTGTFTVVPGAEALVPRPGHADTRGMTALTAAGVSGKPVERLRGACPLLARDRRDPDQIPAIEILPPGRKPFLLKARLGASLTGLATP